MADQGPAGRAAGEERHRGFNRDICGGAFLLAAAAFGYFGTAALETGSISGVGPGMVPKSVAVGLAAFGAFLVGLGLTRTDDRIEAFSLRGTIFALGGILAFSATVRPFGLLVAGPLAMIISSMADPETRPIEIAVFTIFMTGFCFVLFKVVLHLPIPLMPPLLGH